MDNKYDKWSEDDEYYSNRDSDDSPLLSNRYEKNRRHEVDDSPEVEEKTRRSTLTVLAKMVLFSTAMIMFCMLMYIPVYNKASDQVSKGLVDGWTLHTNRDTKIYVQPENVTTIHDPINICDKHKKQKLFLLIVVCSATGHFKQRLAIRKTWGNYKSYLETDKIYHEVRRKYENYNFTYDLYPNGVVNVSGPGRKKRDLSGFSQLLPALADALQNNLDNMNTGTPEKRFDDDMLPEFDMNEEIGDHTDENPDYYDTNIMRIAPNGFAESPDLKKLLRELKKIQNFSNVSKTEEKVADSVSEPVFKVVFLLGLPSNDNDSKIQGQIEEEAAKYGDVIQEGFIDSYNNLTLKSIMMLKWVTNNCRNGVRYILKTDDDMYVNVPNLIENLQNRSKEFDTRVVSSDTKEYLLIGDLICGARPVLDSNNKWFSPKYMYRGRVYPKYLSGTGYALSLDAASALYEAALRTTYFHLEDVFITGICSGRAHPRITPRDDPLFSYQPARGMKLVCAVHAHVTAHRITPNVMSLIHKKLLTVEAQDECERIRLTQVRKDRLKPKPSPKKSKIKKLVRLKK